MNSNAALTHITREFRRLEKAGDYKGLKAYLRSPQYESLSAALSPEGRMRAGGVMADVVAKLLPRAPLPKKWSRRVRWTADRIEALKASYARYGEDKAVAREMGVPFHNLRRARLRYIGRNVPHATTDQR